MPSILLTVFLIQLLIHLINTIGAKTINDLLWRAYAMLPLPSSQSAQEVTQLRRDVVRLKREMNAISAQDDFARWAKIRREHDKVLAEHDRKAADLSTSRSSFDTKASALRWLATTGLRFGLQFWHAKTPMFLVPKGWFPWYVEWVLGFPRCPYGGVSINTWTTVCGVVIALVGDLVAWGLGMGQEMQGPGQKQKEKVKIPAASGRATTAEKKTS